jgi:hypothetical protein
MRPSGKFSLQQYSQPYSISTDTASPCLPSSACQFNAFPARFPKTMRPFTSSPMLAASDLEAALKLRRTLLAHSLQVYTIVPVLHLGQHQRRHRRRALQNVVQLPGRTTSTPYRHTPHHAACGGSRAAPALPGRCLSRAHSSTAAAAADSGRTGCASWPAQAVDSNKLSVSCNHQLI